MKACLVDGYGSKSAAGWTSDYSDSNYRTFRAPTGLRYYLRLYDYTASTACAVAGFESMTSTTVGTNMFSASSNTFFSKTNDATTRQWYVGANQTAFWYWTQYDGAGSYNNGWWGYFGELADAAANDKWHTTLIAGSSWACTLKDIFSDTTTITGHACARDYTGTLVDSLVSKTANGRCFHPSGVYAIGKGLLPYPHPDGYLWMSPVLIYKPEATQTARACIRGRLQGLYAPMHPRPAAHGDTFSGLAGSPYAGKSFIALNAYDTAQVAFETSNTW